MPSRALWQVGPNRGGWNGRYRAVHPIDFTGLHRAGRTGEGTVFPHCPQHQVANLAGGRNVVVGAVVNGPNGAENFEDIGIPDGARACPTDGRNRFAAFDRTDTRYLDDVRAWPSVEPATDFTSTGMLAFALTATR